MRQLPKLAVHEAELVEADAATLYSEFVRAEGPDASAWPIWADMNEDQRATWRFAARHPYAND